VPFWYPEDGYPEDVFNCVYMGTVILFLYVYDDAELGTAANIMKLNG